MHEFGAGGSHVEELHAGDASKSSEINSAISAHGVEKACTVDIGVAALSVDSLGGDEFVVLENHVYCLVRFYYKMQL